MAITPTQKAKYWAHREEGFAQLASAKYAGFSPATAARLERAGHYDGKKGRELLIVKANEEFPDPIAPKDLSPEAKRALEDFTYFQERYLGRIGLPWQKEAADELVRLFATENEEYVVQNAPPGSGKSTVAVHDFPLWLIVRDRTIRIMMGSVTYSLAKQYVTRIRRTLEAVVPIHASVDALRRGEAKDAVATLSADFGRFRPLDRGGRWTNEGFVVEQPVDIGMTTEKEDTCTPFGIDSSFIGQRVNAVFWDDMVDPRKLRTVEQKELLQKVYTDVCETRLEPGGLLLLNGQRIDSTDLYRFALDMTAPIDEDDDDDLTDAPTPKIGPDRQGKKYHHLVYKAHYEELCDGTQHKKSAAPWPNGCLLSPRRLNWSKLATAMSQPGGMFETIYQQHDVAPENVLVPNAWIYGADEHPGCIDKWRDRLEIPHGLDRNTCISVATADPSPTNYWSVQWWIWDPATENRYLIDLLRKKMDAPDFIDWSSDQGKFVGVMEEWQDASRTLGFPIQTWIIEDNAAQRFMLQYDHVRRWQSQNEVDILPHTTARNKSDPNYGVETIAPHWRYGRVRLPGRGEGKVKSLHLIDEVRTYPQGRTDDCVMAEWFFEWNLPNLNSPGATTPIAAWRPSWAG